MGIGLGRGVGFDVKTVRIDEIIPNGGRPLAICRDPNGATLQVSLRVRRAKGGWPQVGEQWILTREFGAWSFAAIVGGDPAPPVVSPPSDNAEPWMVQMFDALVHLGLIQVTPSISTIDPDSPGTDQDTAQPSVPQNDEDEGD